MTTNIARARKWLAELRPLYTWAPLLHAAPPGTTAVRTRHAWPLPVFPVPYGPGVMPTHTACRIEAALPNNFSDTSDTPDCEACRDKAAEPLAALLEEAEQRGLERAELACLKRGCHECEGAIRKLGTSD
jgi:hypothetical protein